MQTTSEKRAKTSTTSRREQATNLSEDSEQHWGKWFQHRYYTLEVIQNPIRARMCGFGDKDRRPLAPAAVAKMTVRHEDQSTVDVDDIDIAFFVVTVDLWSEDGKREMNLVLHPSSTDRYVPTQIGKPRRRSNGLGTVPSAPDSQSLQPSLQALPPPAAAYAHAQYLSVYPEYPAPLIPPHDPNVPPYPSHVSYHPHYQDQTVWGYPPYPYQQTAYPAYHHPSSNPYHRAGTPGQAPAPWSVDNPSRGDLGPCQPAAPPASSDSAAGPVFIDTHVPAPQPHGYTAYAPPLPPVDGGPVYAAHPYAPPPLHYPYMPPPPPAPQQLSESLQLAPAYHSQSQASTQAHTSSVPSTNNMGPADTVTSASAGPSSVGSGCVSASGAMRPGTPPSPRTLGQSLHIPRHTYTRTLVGPLSANAARLNDEHRKPGIFFLFQDLSVRTEGTFRLRLRLMNVGANFCNSPGGDSNAHRVMESSAPILAQTFTEPFTVYSAKRFPGVPDTTALSIAFGNQGQKLPLRNRHGSRQSGRRRQQRKSESSQDESDAS